MNQTTNTAATTLEQVNAMPAATWGWLKMNQTKLELSDELAAAPTEAVEVEGLDEQFTGVADAFEAAMDALQPGDISEPLVSRFGVHLIQLMERRQVRPSAREQRDMARDAVRAKKLDEAYTQWGQELRARAYVEYREPPQ